MYLIDDPTSTSSMPAMSVYGTGGWFTEGDPRVPTPATKVRGDWLNMIQAEMKGVLTAAGMTPDQTKVSLNQLATAIQSLISSALVGELNYRGTWNAASNSPTLVSSTGTKGYFYKVATPGTTSIDGKDVWNVGDLILFDGTVWDKIDGTTAEVISFNGRFGTVTLNSADVDTALGFNPVQQGTGVGQTANAIKIGFDGASKVKVTVDGTDHGNIAFESWAVGLFQTALGFTPVQQGTGVGQTPNDIKIGFDGASKVKVTVDGTDHGNLAEENWVTGLFTGSNQSLGSSGYQKFPGGLIRQWGTVTAPNSGASFSNVAVTFPIAFPTRCTDVHGTPQGTANSGLGYYPSCNTIGAASVAGVTLALDTLTGGAVVFNQTVPTYWEAWGF